MPSHDRLLSAMLGWLKEHVWWIAGLSILTFVATLIAIPFVVVRIIRSISCRANRRRQLARPAPRGARGAARRENCLGVILILAGWCCPAAHPGRES